MRKYKINKLSDPSIEEKCVSRVSYLIYNLLRFILVLFAYSPLTYSPFIVMFMPINNLLIMRHPFLARDAIMNSRIGLPSHVLFINIYLEIFWNCHQRICITEYYFKHFFLKLKRLSVRNIRRFFLMHLSWRKSKCGYLNIF